MSAYDGLAAVHAPTPVEAAAAAAEALRLLNHLTIAAPAAGVPGWEDVGDVYRVVGELRVVADRLPQVCDQVVSSLQRLGDRRPWHVDDGTTEHPDEVVSTAVELLQVANCIAEDFGCNVQLAHCAVAHLYQ